MENNQQSFWQFKRTSYGTTKRTDERRNFDIRVGGDLNSSNNLKQIGTDFNDLKQKGTDFNGFNDGWKIGSSIGLGPLVGPQNNVGINGGFKKGIYSKPSNYGNNINFNLKSGKSNGKGEDEHGGKAVGKNNSSSKSNNGDNNNNSKNSVDKRFKTLPPSESLPRHETIGGYIYNDTMQENLKRQLFEDIQFIVKKRRIRAINMDDKSTRIDIDQLASTLRGKLLQKSPLPAQCCIFRVPSTLRRHNQAVFAPRLVSIGPLHHGVKNLQAMEKLKLWYLDCLIARAPTIQTSLECFIEAIRGTVESISECYEEVELSTDEMVEMMVLDSCFIIELFRKHAKIVQPHVDDPIFKMSWMRKDLLTDLLLLENQLPWFVLERLFNLTNADPDPNTPSLADLALKFFTYNTLRIEDIKPNTKFQNKHLLDFQRNNLLSSFAETAPEQTPRYMIPCVTELLQAGVQFKKGEAKDILNIQFNNGVMIIPPIRILDNAESFFHNLIAYEQCDSTCKDKITSYAILWDNLINSSKDLDFLCQEGIITCYLSSEDVSNFFKRLYIDADVMYYSYAKVSHDIIMYCQADWPRWRVILLRDYFNNPWSICFCIGAIVILIMTVTQTSFSLLHH